MGRSPFDEATVVETAKVVVEDDCTTRKTNGRLDVDYLSSYTNSCRCRPVSVVEDDDHGRVSFSNRLQVGATNIEHSEEHSAPSFRVKYIYCSEIWYGTVLKKYYNLGEEF